MPVRQINDPLCGKIFSLLFLPVTPLSQSRSFERLFELTRCPSKALNPPRALLPENRESRTPSSLPRKTQRSQDTVKNN